MRKIAAAALFLTAIASTMDSAAAAFQPAGLSRLAQHAQRAGGFDHVRSRLARAARIGSAGEPHIRVTFQTKACGVRLSRPMRERYPDEMTVVLQYQFEKLAVTAGGFAVDLWFAGRRERVRVPFSAMTAFYEPSAGYDASFIPDVKGGCGLQAGIGPGIIARR